LVSYAGAWLSRFCITEYCVFVVELFVYSVGRERHETGTSLIMDLLQQPRLNKQVAALCVSPRSQLRPLTASLDASEWFVNLKTFFHINVLYLSKQIY